MQTFEKGVQISGISVGRGVGVNLKQNGFKAKIMGVNSVSGEKLHDFEIICQASGCTPVVSYFHACNCDSDINFYYYY